MNKRITFEANDTTQLNERIIEFFLQAGFKFYKTASKKLKFYQSDSIFEAWKTNPLKWKSEIIITSENNQINAEFDVDTEVQMFTTEEEQVWNNFINDFQNFLQQNIVFNTTKIDRLNTNRKSKAMYVAWTIIGALTGGIIGSLIANYFGSKTLVYLCIPIFATLFLKFRINLGRHHNAL